MSEDISILSHIARSHTSIGFTERDKMTCIIKLKDRDGRVVRKKTLEKAWITAYEESDLDALGAEVSLDRIVVSFTDVKYS
jgi:hypothetical protein